MTTFWKCVVKYSVLVFLLHLVNLNSYGALYALARGNLLLWNKPQSGIGPVAVPAPVINSNCAASGQRLLNLLNVVCSTAQPLNTTSRDGCYGCFIRYTPLPQGQQQLIGLSSCASMYFNNTPYAACSSRLALVANNVAILPPTGGQCASAFCEFVRCLRRANANSVIAQCAREVRMVAAVNVALDNDNIRYYTNMTSCILAKIRCNTYNPITGELQLPGVTQIPGSTTSNIIPLYNTLQTATDGSLRIVSFPSTVAVTTTYCSTDTRLTQANWLNNECP